MKKILLAMGCIAWTATAIASATPASAVVGTYAGAGQKYATCGGSYSNNYLLTCNYQFNYQQVINFVSTGCSAGGCAQVSGGNYTDFLYSAGRKPATVQAMCSPPFTVYGLGSCAC